MKPVAPILVILISTTLVVLAADPSTETPKAGDRDGGAAEKVPGKEAHIIKEWKVPADFFVQPALPPKAEQGAKDSTPKPAAPRNQITDFLARNGVTFGADGVAMYAPASGTLLVKNTQAELDKIDALVDAYFAKATKRNPPR